jgi:hypothetical protein
MFSFSLKKNSLKFLYPVFGFLVILELFFQIVFIADIKLFKKPILFFNPYCDQSYWSNIETSSINQEVFQYHPELTLIKKSNNIYYNLSDSKELFSIEDDVILYGSSFIDHKYFLPYFKDNVNYAVKSYGLDQIFLSYKLTKDKHSDDLIIFGFLLEDLDRVLFDKRDYPKVKFNKIEDTYKASNIPVELTNMPNNEIFLYSYNLLKNLSFLYLNNFDHKKSECDIDLKKNLFSFFINEILKNVEELNQKIIFVTFNFQDDIIESNWRYQFISNYLSSKNIIHLDTKDILLRHMKQNNLDPSKYYSKEDFHLNQLGNEIIASELKILIEQHM